MSVSLTTLPIYDEYLNAYRNKNNSNSSGKNSKRSLRHATHDTSELKNLYNAIQWKNRFAPLYI